MSASVEYARALFLVTEENATSDAVLAEARDCIKIFSQNPTYTKIIDSPALSKAERLSLIDEALTGIDEMLLNLFKIMTERREAHLFLPMLKEYSRLYDESRGIATAEVISAVKLSDEALLKIKRELEDKTKKTIVIKETTDPSILGGIKLRYLGHEDDGSLKTRLEKFEKNLKNTIL